MSVAAAALSPLHEAASGFIRDRIALSALLLLGLLLAAALGASWLSPQNP
jgi:hypothetical protein